MKKYGKGWFDESYRHRLARMGIRTGRKRMYSGYTKSLLPKYAKETFEQKLEKVKKEAETPYKTRIMVHRMKQILTEPPKTEKEKREFKEKVKEEEKIFSAGLEAVKSLAEIGHAVSTPKRFQKWADLYGYKIEFWDIDRKSWNKGEPIDRDGKLYYPYIERKQTGYGAYHIGSDISTLKKEGRELLVVDSRRNRRFLYATAKPKGSDVK